MKVKLKISIDELRGECVKLVIEDEFGYMMKTRTLYPEDTWILALDVVEIPVTKLSLIDESDDK